MTTAREAAHGVPLGRKIRGICFLSLAMGAFALAGCSDECCTFDGEPIALRATPDGALWFRVRAEGRQGYVLIDTATPVNLWQSRSGRTEALAPRSFEVLSAVNEVPVLRAVFRDVWFVGVPLAAPPTLDGPVFGVLGGEFWRSFSPVLDANEDMQVPTLSMALRQPAGTGFLDTSRYAVLEMDPLGGGQLDVEGEPDFLGLRGPHQFPGSQLVVRACASPAPFTPTDTALPTCCQGDERRLATGVNLALAVSTGLGPLVLSRSAWERVATATGGPPASPAGPAIDVFHPALAAPLSGFGASLPRLALVNLESSVGQDPGACVELGRARRTELVSMSQAQSSSLAHCAEPCDQDPRSPGTALSSAAYAELSGDIPVVVVDDSVALLQALRAEIRPEGPELDGLIGAAALKSLRIELDYRPRPARLILSCQPSASQTCRAVGRCPRLPNEDSTRVCFDLTRHRLPETCDNRGDACD
ncbi:MAG: hypothetical protein KA712_25475 [Myxococcales bacterium]|nr:hypothetical protein [Myxococcales bacterium]